MPEVNEGRWRLAAAIYEEWCKYWQVTPLVFNELKPYTQGLWLDMADRAMDEMGVRA